MNALPWALVTVLGDEQRRCLRDIDEVGLLSEFYQVFLLIAWVLGQVLTCSDVAGPETCQVVSASLAGRTERSGRSGKVNDQGKMTL